jgi:superkiller protein 3
MWNPRTRRERSIVHAYAGLMHEQGLARAGARLDPTFPGRWEARDAALRAARGDRKAAARTLTDRGFSFSLQERFFEAARSWNDALALDPGRAMAMNGLGELALTEERFADAARWFGAACARAPSAGCRDGLDRTRTAVAAAAKLPALERAAAAGTSATKAAGATAFCELGNAYWRLNRLRAAEATYLHAVALDPRYARAWGNLGSALAEQGRLPDAIRAYRRAVDLEPGNADSLLNLGVVYGRMGRFKPARAWLERALRARPGDPTVTGLLGSMGH